jgi:hypothetical protein
MAQVWVTFEEIKGLFNCDPASARSRVIFSQWERRRFSDGVTRVLLPPEEAYEFMLCQSRNAVLAALCHVLGSEASSPLPEGCAPQAAPRMVAPPHAASRLVEVGNAA